MADSDIQQFNIDEVICYFNITLSIRDTAKKFNTSYSKAYKLLVSRNIIASKKQYTLSEINDIHKSHGGCGTINKILSSDELPAGKSKRRYCELECCGIKKIVVVSSIVSGSTKSCGHLVAESISKIGFSRVEHGHCKNHKQSPEYKIWCGIKSRCTNKNNKDYERYKGKLCPEWQDFDNFYASMGSRPSPNHSVDRIDNNNGYSADNCKWSTTKEQAQNRSTCIFIQYNGKQYNLMNLCREKDINYNTLRLRLKTMNIYDALSTKMGKFVEPTYNKIVIDKGYFNFRKKANRYTRPEDDLTFEEWCDIKKQYEYKCKYCKKSEEDLGKCLTIDHIKPKSSGGFDTKSNIVPACSWCNSSKGTRAEPNKK